MVAKHRKSKPADRAPAELLEFHRADWERPTDTNHFQPFHAWVAARKAFIAAHPDSSALGGVLERLRTESQTQLAQYDPKARSWSDYERGNSSFAWESAEPDPPR